MLRKKFLSFPHAVPADKITFFMGFNGLEEIERGNSVQ